MSRATRVPCGGCGRSNRPLELCPHIMGADDPRPMSNDPLTHAVETFDRYYREDHDR